MYGTCLSSRPDPMLLGILPRGRDLCLFISPLLFPSVLLCRTHRRSSRPQRPSSSTWRSPRSSSLASPASPCAARSVASSPIWAHSAPAIASSAPATATLPSPANTGRVFAGDLDTEETAPARSKANPCPCCWAPRSWPELQPGPSRASVLDLKSVSG